MPRDTDQPDYWLSKAVEHMQAAEHLLNHADSPFIEQACFHIQQSIETALKAVLVAKRQDVPRTHVIADLLDRCGSDSLLDEMQADLAATTIYAVTYRYPTSAATPTLEDTHASLHACQRLLPWVENRIAQSG